MTNGKLVLPAMGKLFLVFDFLVNLGGPFLVYQLAAGHMSETAALMLSSAPPIVWSIGQLIWSRKIDALSLLVIAGIALSLIATLMGGSPRLLLVRESFVTRIFGLIFLGLLLFRRPLMFLVVKSTVTAGRGRARSSEQPKTYSLKPKTYNPICATFPRRHVPDCF